MTFIDSLVRRLSPAGALDRAVRLTEQGKTERAFALLTRAAQAGIAEAEYRIARCYLEGVGVPQSRSEGTRWLERAAEHDAVDAQWLLASLCAHGLVKVAAADAAQPSSLFAASDRIEPDFDTALKWARRAASAGTADGQTVLAYVLTYGPERMRDLEEAHRLYLATAKTGSPQGCLGLALSLARRASDEATRREVAEYLRRAAEAQVPTAIYLLAVLTEQGVGVAADAKAAVQLYRHAADHGVRAAQLRWGAALMAGEHVAQDPLEGESWLRRAALAGDAEAAALVGDLNAKSGVLPPNFSEAANWYRRAAEAGHQSAARALGSLYLTGAGVAQDADEAARWLRVSAESGNPASQVDLANLLLKGAGSAEDPARVAQWFEQAASTGDLVAAYNFGLCLARGVGVGRDEQQAGQWLRRAAEGVPNAQYMYGRMLSEGRGVAPNLVEARAWFTRAAEAGMPEAQVALGEMLVNGRGGPRDVDGALARFGNAAAKGHSGAMYALAAVFGGGYELPADRTTAQLWLRRAAERGHGHAQMMLGRYLAAGTAGERNLDEARLWFERAVSQGVAEAHQDLAALPPPQEAVP